MRAENYINYILHFAKLIYIFSAAHSTKCSILQKKEEFEVKFIFSTYDRDDEVFDTSFNPESVTNFNPKFKTFVVVHGFMTDPSMPAVVELTDQLLELVRNLYK